MSIATTGALGSPPAEPPAGRQPVRPRSLLDYAQTADATMFVAWTMSTTLPLGFLGPIRYLAAAYFAGAFILFARQVSPALARCWPLFMLPVLCTISALWAPSMNEALRKGVSLGLTSVVAIYVATRIPGRKILFAYFAAGLIAALMSLRMNVIDQQGAWTGVFGQKNFFAVNMFVLYVSALGLALDKENGRWLRRVATASAPLALLLVVLAKSGTTTLLVLGTTLVMVGQTLIWQPASKIPNARALIVTSFAVIGLAGAYVAFGILQIDVMKEVLGALGKDSTLTGRTMLWELAERSMAEHPWTGLGANGYWRVENGMANTITNILQGSERFTSFTFHNSYYENGVSYGYPGYWATMILAVWACASAAMNWIRRQTAVNAAFLVFALMIILRSTSEADLSGEFGAMIMILLISASRKEHLAKPQRPAGGIAMARGKAGA